MDNSSREALHVLDEVNQNCWPLLQAWSSRQTQGPSQGVCWPMARLPHGQKQQSTERTGAHVQPSLASNEIGNVAPFAHCWTPEPGSCGAGASRTPLAPAPAQQVSAQNRFPAFCTQTGQTIPATPAPSAAPPENQLQSFQGRPRVDPCTGQVPAVVQVRPRKYAPQCQPGSQFRANALRIVWRLFREVTSVARHVAGAAGCS